MRKIFWVAIIAGFVCTLDAAAAAAQTTPLGTPPKAAPAHRGKTAKPHRTPATSGSLASPAANLNAPSTDFSNVEADTGEPRERRRQQGPDIRPSIDSNGRPVMGLGF